MTAESAAGENTDAVATLLRIQIHILETVLKNIAHKNPLTNDTHESLKQVEKNLRWLRKLLFNNV